MKYTMTTPCDECPFLKKWERGYSLKRLNEFVSNTFPCHKTAEVNEEDGTFETKAESVHCAGSLIYNEKRNNPNQMMRIAERLGMYDRTKLNMKSKIR